MYTLEVPCSMSMEQYSIQGCICENQSASIVFSSQQCLATMCVTTMMTMQESAY